MVGGSKHYCMEMEIATVQNSCLSFLKHEKQRLVFSGVMNTFLFSPPLGAAVLFRVCSLALLCYSAYPFHSGAATPYCV